MNRPLTSEYLQRFGGLGRLYGQAALPALTNAHFAVIGLGGVGTWVAEALARSGVGELTLIEMDEVFDVRIVLGFRCGKRSSKIACFTVSRLSRYPASELTP